MSLFKYQHTLTRPHIVVCFYSILYTPTHIHIQRECIQILYIHIQSFIELKCTQCTAHISYTLRYVQVYSVSLARSYTGHGNNHPHDTAVLLLPFTLSQTGDFGEHNPGRDPLRHSIHMYRLAAYIPVEQE